MALDTKQFAVSFQFMQEKKIYNLINQNAHNWISLNLTDWETFGHTVDIKN